MPVLFESNVPFLIKGNCKNLGQKNLACSFFTRNYVMMISKVSTSILFKSIKGINRDK